MIPEPPTLEALFVVVREWFRLLAAGREQEAVAQFDEPNNYTWSELTAQFEFLRRPGGLAVVLHDLHVP